MLTGHLHLAANPYKMSKSRFNTVEVTELLEHYTANQFRLMCLMEEPYHMRTFQIVVVPTSLQMEFMGPDFYRPQTEVWGRVMFSQVFVCRGEGDGLHPEGGLRWGVVSPPRFASGEGVGQTTPPPRI